MNEAQDLKEDSAGMSLEIFTEVLIEAATGMKRKSTNTGKQKYDNKWFDNDCHSRRRKK